MKIPTLEIDPDLDEIVRLAGSPAKDPNLLKDARDRAEVLRLELLAKYGVRDVAVELIHDARDGR